MKYGVLALLVSAVLSGCSSEKDASEANFKTAAQANFDAKGPDCYFLSYFPIETEHRDKEFQTQLQLLEKAGLLTVNNQAKIVTHSMFGDTTEKTGPGYELTDEGKKAFKEGVETQVGGTSLGGFCFGKSEVVEISNFSEINSSMGQSMSVVKYTYKVSGLPEWTKDPAVYNAFNRDSIRYKSLKKAVESEKTPIQDSSSFILTDKGWMHSDQFRK